MIEIGNNLGFCVLMAIVASTIVAGMAVARRPKPSKTETAELIAELRTIRADLAAREASK